MKFKFKGRDGMKDFNLACEGILPMEESLKRGQVVDVPDRHKIIPRLRENGLWEELSPSKESAKKGKSKTTKRGE